MTEYTVEVDYRSACFGWAVGFTTPWFFASTGAATLLLWYPMLNSPVWFERFLTAMFIFCAIGGALGLAFALVDPIRFYEVFEDPPEELKRP